MHHLADAGLPGRLGEPHRADDIDRGVELRVGDGVAHVDLGGQVEDHLGPGVGEQSEEVGADDVGLGEIEVGGALGRTMFSLRPELRSSTPTTLWPSASRRSTSVDPMKPAAPVTSVRIGTPYRGPLCARLDHRLGER